MNIKLLTSSRHELFHVANGAAVQLICTVSWFEIGFAGWNCKVPPLIAKSPTVYVAAASSSEKQREKILPSFALFYWDLVSFCLFRLFNWPALSLQSHQSDLRHPLAPNPHPPFSLRVGAYCTGFSVPASCKAVWSTAEVSLSKVWNPQMLT